MTAIPVGTKVRYHGSDPDYHGEYIIDGHDDLSVRKDLWRHYTEEEMAGFYPDGVGYSLWPVGVPVKFGNRHLSLSFVRPQSFTVIED